MPGLIKYFRKKKVSIDITPEIFTFDPSTEALAGAEYISNSITISGVTPNTPISCSGGLIQINSGSWVSSGVVSNNDTVKTKVTSPPLYPSKVATSVVTIGAVSKPYSVTTKSSYPGCLNFIGTNNALGGAGISGNSYTGGGVCVGLDYGAPDSFNTYIPNDGQWYYFEVDAGHSLGYASQSEAQHSSGVCASATLAATIFNKVAIRWEGTLWRIKYYTQTGTTAANTISGGSTYFAIGVVGIGPNGPVTLRPYQSQWLYNLPTDISVVAKYPG